MAVIGSSRHASKASCGIVTSQHFSTGRSSSPVSTGDSQRFQRHVTTRARGVLHRRRTHGLVTLERAILALYIASIADGVVDITGLRTATREANERAVSGRCNPTVVCATVITAHPKYTFGCIPDRQRHIDRNHRMVRMKSCKSYYCSGRMELLVYISHA